MEEMGKLLNLSKATVAQWEAKDTNPTLNVLETLSSVFELRLDYFIKNDKQSEKEAMLISQFNKLYNDQQKTLIDFATYLVKENKKREELVESEEILPLTYKRSELFENIYQGFRASAGLGIAISTEDIEILYTDFPLKAHDGIAMVDGESMNRTFRNGTYCTFKNTGFDQDGDFYAVSEGDSVQENLYIKQVFWDEERQQYRLHSTNPEYKDFWLGEEDGVIIAGAVIQNFEAIEESQIEN